MPRRLRVSRLQALTMTAASGAYSWAGFNATLSRAQHLTISANSGIFQWAGQNAVLQKQKFLLTALSGSYAITGQSATFTYTPVVAGPTWIGTIPTETFTKGAASSPVSLASLLSNYNPSLHFLSVTSGALPTGIGINQTTPSITYDDTISSVGVTSGIILTITDTASADWAARSAGAVLADRLGTNVKLVPGNIDATHWVLNDPNAGHITFDSTQFPPGSTGSWKQAVLNSDGAGSGNIGIYFGNVRTFGQGDTYWVSFRKRGTPQALYQPYIAIDGTTTWSKLSISSNALSSSVVNEVVTVTPYGGNEISGYHQNGNGFPTEDVGMVSVANNSDFNSQFSINRGVNPLTGVNPDTGSAWSQWEQQRAQWGLLYSARSSPRAENFREGYGDPWSGGWREKPNQWNTYLLRIVIGTWGVANSRYTLWAANEGLAPDQIFDSQNITLGNWANHDTLWLLHYVTNRQSGVGRQVASRTNNISGATIHVVGNATPIGVGNLEYNATTQRFRYQAAGESFGVTRGFSSANNKLIFNATSSVAGSYLVVEVNPALLPTSGTIVDTVTISNLIPDTSVWYADPIISTSRINFPGGFVPVG